MKWERLSIIVRIGLGFFAAFGAFGSWSIAAHIKSSDDYLPALVAILFTGALLFGAITGRFPSVPNQRRGNSNDGK